MDVKVRYSLQQSFYFSTSLRNNHIKIKKRADVKSEYVMSVLRRLVEYSGKHPEKSPGYWLNVQFLFVKKAMVILSASETESDDTFKQKIDSLIRLCEPDFSAALSTNANTNTNTNTAGGGESKSCCR